MPSKKKFVKVYLSDDEMNEVNKITNKANISNSEFGRRCLLGRQLPDAHRQKDILALLKVNADLARIGNLLKMLLDDEEIISLIKTEKVDIDDLIWKIRTNQGDIQHIAANIKLPGKLHPQ